MRALLPFNSTVPPSYNSFTNLLPGHDAFSVVTVYRDTQFPLSGQIREEQEFPSNIMNHPANHLGVKLPPARTNLTRISSCPVRKRPQIRRLPVVFSFGADYAKIEIVAGCSSRRASSVTKEPIPFLCPLTRFVS